MAKKAGAAAQAATGVAVKEVNNLPELKILSPEEYEVEMEKKISGDLAKYNLADTKIAELKEKYAGITVTDIKNKTQLKTLRDALSDVVKIRTGISKKKEEINAEYLRLQRAVNGEEKRLIALVSEIEQPLKEENERVKALEKEEAERKEREEQEKLNERVETLKNAGIVYDGSFYSIANISVDIVTIKSMKDSDFSFLVAKVEVEAKRIAEEKAEQDRIAREKAEQERIEREEFEANQRKLEEERAEFQRQQDEFAAKQKEAADAEAKQKADALAEVVANRTDTLEALGFLFKKSTNQFVFEKEGGTAVVDYPVLETSSREFFNQTVSEIKERISQINKATAEIVAEREEQQKEADRKEQQRKEQEAAAEKERLENERVAKEQKERELEEERLKSLPDIQKVSDYVLQLVNVPKPEVTNEQMIAYLQAIDEFLTESNNLIFEELQSITPGE